MNLPILKECLNELKQAFKEITRTGLLNEYSFSDGSRLPKGQYWELELAIFDEDADVMTCKFGYFTGKGRFRNTDLGINHFFKNNDLVIDEFYQVLQLGAFNSLVPILVKLGSFNIDYSYSISLNSGMSGGSEMLRDICDECVLIMHLHQEEFDKVDISCMQSERYKIKTQYNGEETYLTLPFDKCSFFPNHERVEHYQNKKYYQYQVALSFAGEDREYVYSIAQYLRKSNIRMFYDEYERVALWGKDLYAHLDDIYRNKSQFCIMFVSESYKEKLWTSHERRSAQARAFQERNDYILPIKIHDVEIPGMLPTTGYIDANKHSVKDIAIMIAEKINSHVYIE